MSQGSVDREPAEAPKPQGSERLIPKLRADLRLYPSAPDSDGAEAWTLFDPVSDKYYKIGPADHALLSKLDKAQSVEELRQRLAASGAENGDSFLAKSIETLSANGLLELGYGSDAALSMKREKLKSAKLSAWLLSSYLFLDVPLFRPDAFFARSVGFVSWLFNFWTLAALSVVSVAGYASLLPRAEALSSSFWNSLDFEGFAAYALAIVAIKIVHECAHAYAAKAQGVRVRRMGLAFIVFIPRFYTDLTDAWRIPSRAKRALIDGAGIASELLIGGFAAALWAHSAPGTLKTVAFYVFAVSAVNTVFINGNPFIKYDGYYLLMDLVGIDNLYARGVSLVRGKFRLWALGLKTATQGEGAWLSGWRSPFMACFAVSSIIYRIFLYATIIAIVYLQFTKVLGIALFALEAYLLMLRPLIAEFKDIHRLRAQIDRKRLAFSAVAAFALLLLFLVPLPWTVSMQCETRSAKTESVCAKDDGFLDALHAEDGARVEAGQAVFSQKNPFFEWSRQESSLQARSDALELDQMRSDKKRLGGLEVQLRRLEQSRQNASEMSRRLSILSVKASQSGVFSLFDKRLKPGKWLFAGEALGEIFDPSSTEALAYVGESDVSRLSKGEKASVCLSGSLWAFEGKVESVNAIPTKTPDAMSPLLDLTGGPVKTLRAPEDQSIRLQSPLYLVRISLDSPEGIPPGRTGVAKATIFQSLGVSAFRSVLSVLQKEFSF